MVWPFTRKAEAPEQKFASPGGYFFGTRLIQPAAASYGRLSVDGYGRNAVAYACVNLIATAASSIELKHFKQTGDHRDEIHQSDLLKLINNPNPMQSGAEFMRHLVSYYALSGNAYVNGPRAGKAPKQLYLLSPAHVEVKAGPYLGIPARYEYKPDANAARIYPVDQLTAASEVLHVKTFNPLSPWYGMAPMDAAALAIDLHNAGNIWNYSLLSQGARPSGALVVKAKDGQAQNLTDEQFGRLKGMLDDQYAGAGNNGKPLLLEGGLEWQEMSLSPTDMDFMDGKHAAAREIALAFGVPPMLLGIPGDSTYNNMAEARLALYTDTVLPLLQLIIGGLNRWLTPLYGEGLYLWYDEEMIPALEPLRKAKSDRINAAGYLSVNEKREAMGYDSIDGGDAVLVNGGLVPLELVGTVPDLAEPGSAADEDTEEDDESAD